MEKETSSTALSVPKDLETRVNSTAGMGYLLGEKEWLDYILLYTWMKLLSLDYLNEGKVY
jgi:hypothetical protein